jgi:hypothetical protein
MELAQPSRPGAEGADRVHGLLQTHTPSVLPFLIAMVDCTTWPALQTVWSAEVFE